VFGRLCVETGPRCLNRAMPSGTGAVDPAHEALGLPGQGATDTFGPNADGGPSDQPWTGEKIRLPQPGSEGRLPRGVVGFGARELFLRDGLAGDVPR
jgi:hypothetical protein